MHYGVVPISVLKLTIWTPICSSSSSTDDTIHAFALESEDHDHSSTISSQMTSNKLENDVETSSCHDGMVTSSILHSHEHPDAFIVDLFGGSLASHYWHVSDQLIIPDSMSVVSREIISVSEYADATNRFPSHANGFDDECTLYQDMLLWDY